MPTDADALASKIVELVRGQQYFVATSGPQNPDVMLVSIPVLVYLILDGAARSDFADVAVGVVVLAYVLIWFDRHVAVFVPPYTPQEAKTKLEGVIDRA